MAALRILIVHNRYQQAGGEDSVCAAEIALLREGGHDVHTLFFDNSAIQGTVAAARAALFTPYNPQSRRRVENALDAVRPDVVHVHNWFPVASPSIFHACSARGVATVWTLHNFRLTCVNGLLFRDGRVCEECLGKVPLAGVRHRCYRGSGAGSAVVAITDGLHRAAGTWSKINRLIALNEFARGKFVEAGLPEERLVVKPNFVADPRPYDPDAVRRGAVFVGRLSPEKGVRVLVDAWRSVDAPLTIIGTGPQEAELRALAGPNVAFAGAFGPEAVYDAVAGAAALIVPSLWYENFPMVIVEAFALGTPVIASDCGALSHIVEGGVNGWHFATGDAADLARVARHAFADPAEMRRRACAARRTYEQALSPQRNLAMIESIYADAIADAAAQR